jgi:hypothetical protein
VGYILRMESILAPITKRGRAMSNHPPPQVLLPLSILDIICTFFTLAVIPVHVDPAAPPCLFDVAQ